MAEIDWRAVNDALALALRWQELPQPGGGAFWVDPQGCARNGHPDYAGSWEAAGRLADALQARRCAVRWSNKNQDWCWWAYVWLPGIGAAEGVCQAEKGPQAMAGAALCALAPEKAKELGL